MAPIPFTLGASGVQLMPDGIHYQANLLGSVNPNGTATNWWFAYGTDPALSGATLTASTAAGSGTTPVTVTASVTTLTANQTYYFQVIGQQGGTSYPGAILSFTTVPPTTVLTTSMVAADSPTGRVTTPHFGWPFKIVSKGASVVEQDSGQEIYASIAAIINTQVGEIPELPTLGLPDLTFAQMPPDAVSLANLIERQEPRATEEVIARALDETGGSWQITLTPNAAIRQT